MPTATWSGPEAERTVQTIAHNVGGVLSAPGYSGGSNPQSVAPLAFPLSFLVVIVAGVPAALVCAVAWVGYAAAARRSRQPPRR